MHPLGLLINGDRLGLALLPKESQGRSWGPAGRWFLWRSQQQVTLTKVHLFCKTRSFLPFALPTLALQDFESPGTGFECYWHRSLEPGIGARVFGPARATDSFTSHPVSHPWVVFSCVCVGQRSTCRRLGQSGGWGWGALCRPRALVLCSLVRGLPASQIHGLVSGATGLGGRIKNPQYS